MPMEPIGILTNFDQILTNWNQFENQLKKIKLPQRKN